MIPFSEQIAAIKDRRMETRRNNSRAGVDWPVTVITADATHQGKTINISRGGALIYLAQQLAVGDNVRLAIEIPDCQDAIVVKGEVVREFPLATVAEEQFSHGIALRFTEMTDENLKFFSGNLAMEWKEDYSESYHVQKSRRSERGNKNRNYILWGLALILLLPITFSLYMSNKAQTDLQNEITRLDSRLRIIEEQLKSYQQVHDSLKDVGGEINNLQAELSGYKSQLPAAETLQTMLRQLDNQKDLIEKIFAELESSREPVSIAPGNTPQVPDNTPQVQKESSYIVKKGENLYRISLKTGITIAELRKLNNLGSDDQIYPGQKLTIR